MTQAAWSGPIISFGKEVPGPDNNEAQGPSCFDQAWSLMDPRALYAYSGGNKWRGWLDAAGYTTIAAIPGTVSATALAASNTGGAAAALTLATASDGAISISQSVVKLSTGTTVTGQIGIDVGTGGTGLTFGSSGFGSIWNPTGLLSRNISITAGATDSAQSFTVAGYDIYGAAMSEVISSGSSGAAAVGGKAFKYITSVTSTTSFAGTTLGVGTLCGFPIRVDNLEYVNIWRDSTTITALTAAVTSSATTTTGDTRGTFAIGTISPTSRIVVFQRVSAVNITSAAGLTGVPQA